MIRADHLVIVLFLLVAIVLAVRLVLPYRLDDTRELSPQVYVPRDGTGSDDYLARILAHNLWDPARLPLARSATEQQQISAGGGSQNAGTRTSQSGPTMRLMGISRGEDTFALIEFDKHIERYTSGDTLPDGSRLEEVLQFAVRISRAGEDEKLHLFKEH